MKKKQHVGAWIFLIFMCFTTTFAYAQSKEAKYVFYFIGDGMGVNQVNGTEMYLGELDGKIGTTPICFASFPYSTFATSFSATNGVTDSAAGGTALATGQKTYNSAIGMNTEKEPIYSVAVQAQKAGRKVGVATSVSIDHATPASFYAHQPNRKMYYEIATDLPKTGFDFYAGSGFLQIKSKKDSKAIDLYTLFDKEGYTIAKGYQDYNQKWNKTNKLILTQVDGKDSSSLPYAIDRQEDDLTLAQITESAIRFLSKDNSKGFFLMVEGGKIDWACHGNDAATVFNEVIDMDNAVKLAYDFYLQHPDETLIVITADHETGGIVLGKGPYKLNLKALASQKVSQDKLSALIKDIRKEKNNRVSWDDIKNLLKENMGFWDTITLTEKQEKHLKEVYDESFSDEDVKMTKNEYAQNEPLATAAKEILNDIALVGWVSGGHSDGYVPVFAIGVGAELFQGRMDNTQIPQRIAKAANY